MKILTIGSSKPELHKIALEIFQFCHDNKIKLLPEWVPRNLNTQADVVSKSVDFDDWRTTREFFEYLNRLWGPHAIDRFAIHKTRTWPGLIPDILCLAQRLWMPLQPHGQPKTIG